MQTFIGRLIIPDKELQQFSNYFNEYGLIIILASGLVYSIGTFLPFGVGNIAIATLVLSAANIDEAQAITIGIVEVATSLTLSVPMGIFSMGITGMPEEEKSD